MCMKKITKYLMHAVIGTLKFNLEKKNIPFTSTL